MKTQPIFVVALFDVLGFEERLKASGLNKLVRAYDYLLKIVKRQRDGMMLHCGVPAGKGGRAAAFGYLDIQQDYFSDTIILWCSYNHFCFGPFIGTCIEFVCQVLHSGLPIRGGIAVGEAVMDKSKRIYIGAPLVEAARVEQAQSWIGVSFGPSFATKPYNEYFEPDSVLVYTAHRKPGRSQWLPGLVLDWPRYWRDTYSILPERHLSLMNKKSKHRRYYDRAIHFCEFSRKHQDWHQTGHLSVPYV